MEAIRNGCVIYVLSVEWMKIVAFLFQKIVGALSVSSCEE